MEQQKKGRLQLWQDKYDEAKNAQSKEREQMEFRDQRLAGVHLIRRPDGTEAQAPTHVRNVCAEMIEAQVDTAIPQPKITAKRQEDAYLARKAEDLIRNLLDQLPMERLNDEDERVCPTQGGSYYLVSWLASKMGVDWLGELQVDGLNPIKVVPQPDVYEIPEMDYVFTDEPITKKEFERRYNKKLENEGEDTPEARGTDATARQTEEIVTLHTAYYKNDRGGIGRYRWVEGTEAEDLDDYQARRVKVCAHCGEIGDGVKCRFCGSTKFDEVVQEYEELEEDLEVSENLTIPAMSQGRDENGQLMWDVEEVTEEPVGGGGLLPQLDLGAPMIRHEQRVPHMVPTKIPYYRPNVYPLVLRKNVSRPGHLLGGSDVDALEDAQNSLNAISSKIKSKVLGGGSAISKPKGMRVITDGDNQVFEVSKPSDMELLQVFNLQVDISRDLEYRAQIYEEARQVIGVTDSMQGRRDPTATSRVAKEFSAERAQGRLESKRTMKQAAYADLFKILFQFMLAYADEPRPLRSFDEDGNEEYTVFDRHEFLYQDDAGNWAYNDDFIFSVDAAAPLASNRTALWQETRYNLESGALGDQTQLSTKIRFWTIMEQLHYPLAGQVLSSLREEQKAAQEQAMMQQAAMQGGMAPPNGESFGMTEV